ncbi:MAG: rubredoxin [Clostridia bacterium]|nr:rubredoxin [Clostridia bacterium]
MKYICPICSYEYDRRTGDEENGIIPRTDFEDLPNEWVCPMCGTVKDEFEIIDEYE